MRVLLTNDDGVRSAGIQAIRAALTGVCTSVVTVAPDGERSGFARKCTFDRPVGVRRLEGGPHPVFECDGTPTDCVRAGLLGGLAAEADLVVSGINHGANVADDVVYSGTVGAGLEAAVLGTPALCLSQQTPAGSRPVNYTEHPGPGGAGYDFGLAARHGYRRLLAVYPAEHRRKHQDEMLGVLMTGARAGQHWPGRAESADLIGCPADQASSAARRHPPGLG